MRRGNLSVLLKAEKLRTCGGGCTLQVSFATDCLCERESSGLLFIGAVEHISASRSLLTGSYVCCHLGLTGAP